jgi:hypothetical protein
MVKFVPSKNRSILVVIEPKDQGTERKSNGKDVVRVLILELAVEIM